MHITDRTSRNLCIIILSFLASAAASAAGIEGRVISEDGAPIEGAMVTVRFGSPFQERTVFSNAAGRYQVRGLPESTEHLIRVRRIGWHDLRVEGKSTPAEGDLTLYFKLKRHTEAAAVAEQLPANHWYALVLDQLADEAEREQVVRQCTYCHQQGNAGTRIRRDEAEWRKILALMARMGGGLDADLAERMPEIFNRAYDPATAIPALTRGFDQPGFAPPPSKEVLVAVVDEYELGGRSSMQHDMIVHPNGDIYSVDMATDNLFRLDPSVPGGKRYQYLIPDLGLPIGGVMASGALPSNTSMRMGPHSLQVDAEGGIWITAAIGNRLVRFDPADESFRFEELPEGVYPHTLRIDHRGRIWYTLAVSNHVGVYDPASGKHDIIRVPARGLGEELVLRMIPFFLWLGQYIDLNLSGGEGSSLPVPYGIDLAPNGGVWFSQLNAHRIGHIDPDSFEVTMMDTPFTAPRRMRFDSKGKLWIPGFSSNLVSSFDSDTGEFKSYELPIEPLGTETPYALNVDLATDDVWICGTNSDTLIRFNPTNERFTVYPLPTRVTYTRDIDFSSDGGVWSSNSNAPAWQIETGVPRVLKLDPGRVATMVGSNQN
jgi:streptogramin lyase